MPRFITFAYDDDQQQHFIDFVEATDAVEAGFQTLEAREDCQSVLTKSPAALRELADQCEAGEEISP